MRMQRRNQEHEQDITTLTKQLTELQRNIVSTGKHEQTVLQQAYEIGNLQEQLNIMTSEMEKMEKSYGRLKRRCTMGDKIIRNLEDELMMAKEAGEEEGEKRKESERKLKKYLDAQKKMAAEFSGLSG